MTLPTPGELLAEYRRHQHRRRLSDSAVKHGRYQVVALAKFVKPKHVLNATREDIADYIDELTVVAATQATYVAHLKSFYKWAKSKGYVANNPCAELESPKLGRRVPRPIDDDDLDEAMERAMFGNPDPRMVAWLTLMGCQGARCIEV